MNHITTDRLTNTKKYNIPAMFSSSFHARSKEIKKNVPQTRFFMMIVPENNHMETWESIPEKTGALCGISNNPTKKEEERKDPLA